MIRAGVFLGAGILAAICFACVPPPPSSPQAYMPAQPALAPTVASVVSPVCPDGTTQFFSKIGILDWKYDPKQNGSGYDPPGRHATTFASTANNNISRDLANAFNDAPGLVQVQLCGLTAIYISPADCTNGKDYVSDSYSCFLPDSGLQPGESFSGSWGFRSRAHNDYRNTYISISAALWSGPNQAWTISTYENSILQYLISVLQPASGWPNAAKLGILSANPDLPELTVLAALAHELGHVQWVLDTAAKPGDPNNFDALESCGSPTMDFFEGWHYSTATDLEPPKRWRKFADRHNNHNNSVTAHAFPPDLSDFANSADPNGLLFQLYQADQPNLTYQPWASLFGAMTPDEDFVETYVLYALLGNKLDNSSFSGTYLQSLPVTIPGYALSGPANGADLPAEVLAGNKTELAAKIRCIQTLFPSQIPSLRRLRRRK